jgi:hypothetical protein
MVAQLLNELDLKNKGVLKSQINTPEWKIVFWLCCVRGIWISDGINLTST